MSPALEQRAAVVIDELQALPAGDRATAAERLCGGDAGLLDGVRALLAAIPRRELNQIELTAAGVDTLHSFSQAICGQWRV